MSCILGVDPGLSGAFCFYFTAAPTRAAVFDMPCIDGQVNGVEFADRLKQIGPDFAVIELVGAMPGQGVSSMFKFGRSFGTVIGVIQALHIPHRFVTPGKWKRHYGLNADKEKSRAMALQTFTDTAAVFARKKDDGRAEAALLAKYGADVLLAQPAPEPFEQIGDAAVRALDTIANNLRKPAAA